MNQLIAESEPRSENRRGVEAGEPRIPSNANVEQESLLGTVGTATEFDGAFVPESWLEHLRQQATRPLPYSDQLGAVVVECDAKQAAETRRGPSRYAVTTDGIPPGMKAGLIATLILLVIAMIARAVG